MCGCVCVLVGVCVYGGNGVVVVGGCVCVYGVSSSVC